MIGYVIVNDKGEFFDHVSKANGEVILGDWMSSKVYASRDSAEKRLSKLKQWTREPLTVCEV